MTDSKYLCFPEVNLRRWSKKMPSFPDAIDEYKKQLERGYVQVAYQGLMEFFRKLKAHFATEYPAFSISTNIYYGYMDMTYFSLVPNSLKRQKLKIALVFLHDDFRFEVWLSGSNRDVQEQYWDQLKTAELGEYFLVSNPRAVDYVLGHTLVGEPDFKDLDGLTKQIEVGTLDFIRGVENILSRL